MEEKPMNEFEADKLEVFDKIFSENGWGTKLMSPIGRVQLANKEEGEAFQMFLDRLEIGESYCLIDLLLASELSGKKHLPVCKTGFGVYLMNCPATDAKLQEVLFSCSVPGICGLLRLSNGVTLEIPSGVEPEVFFRYRFFLLHEKDADAVNKATQSLGNAKLTKVGNVTPGILKVSASEKKWEKPLEDFLPKSVIGIQIGDDCESAFEQGKNAALSSYCCSLLPFAKSIHFPSDLDFPKFFATVLGLCYIIMSYEMPAQSLRFSEAGNVGLVVPRPDVQPTDQLFVLRPKAGEDGCPKKEQVGKLKDYLVSETTAGHIKSVLPMKKNAKEMIRKLCGETMEFRFERDLPDGFAMLAIVSEENTVAGSRIGTFQSI